MNIIAIDCGASFIKGALFQDNKIIKEINRKAPKVHNDWSILIPTQITKLIEIVKAVLNELIEGQKEVIICISNEMHGFILTDESGNPFTDYISWQKEYGNIVFDSKTAKHILECYAMDILYSGMPVRAGLPNSNLLYLYISGMLDKAEKKLYFYTLGDYIIRIISNRQPVCHLSNAAATGLVNLLTGEWNERLLEVTCGNKVIFPKIGMESIDVLYGDCMLHILPAIGDQQAALKGAGMDFDTDISFNLGTGAQVSKIVQQPHFSKDYQVRPYLDGRFIKTIPHLPSGRAMNVYIRFIHSILVQFGMDVDDNVIWDSIIANLNVETHTCLKCDLSFFENPITSNNSGSIINIPEYGFSMESLFQALFCQMADNFLWAADKIELTKDRTSRLFFSGGIARKIPYIRKKIEEKYNGITCIIAPKNETLYGLCEYALDFLKK